MLPDPPDPQDRFRAESLNPAPQPADPADMSQELPIPATNATPTPPTAPASPEATAETEAKPDSLASFAVDANALARAIWSGRGDDVSRLVADLLHGRDAA